MKFELICVDMFQTLVNVNTRIPFIWKRILKDQYNEALALECAKSVSKYKFDEIFISENVMSYKNAQNSKIFTEVLKHYSINPNKVLHIGDSSSDIIGANKIGIKTCWINREGGKWKYTQKPDYIINSLNEIVDIIGFKNSITA